MSPPNRGISAQPGSTNKAELLSPKRHFPSYFSPEFNPARTTLHSQSFVRQQKSSLFSVSGSCCFLLSDLERRTGAVCPDGEWPG